MDDWSELIQALWWAKKGIGRWLTTLLRKLRVVMVLGYMPTYIELKETWEMQPTGTEGQTSLLSTNESLNDEWEMRYRFHYLRLFSSN